VCACAVGNRDPGKFYRKEKAGAIHRKELSMSIQANQEKQQAESLATSEGQQSLLTERETSQQELVELSGEQLMEIAGGVLPTPTREQLKQIGMCCALGAGTLSAAASAAATHMNKDPYNAATAGAGIGAQMGLYGWIIGQGVAKCIGCIKEKRAAGKERDVESGLPHGGQHHE
jgi:hypothetical protein